MASCGISRNRMISRMDDINTQKMSSTTELEGAYIPQFKKPFRGREDSPPSEYFPVSALFSNEDWFYSVKDVPLGVLQIQKHTTDSVRINLIVNDSIWGDTLLHLSLINGIAAPPRTRFKRGVPPVFFQRHDRQLAFAKPADADLLIKIEYDEIGYLLILGDERNGDYSCNFRKIPSDSIPYYSTHISADSSFTWYKEPLNSEVEFAQ